MKKPSGQTLVLFALTLMLLTLLVLMTLSFGSKVKSRMEAQTTADAAAYSNAVAAARTMNAIAVMNRVNVAHTVSTIGTLSLISWVTLYYNHATNVRDLWLLELAVFAVGALFWCLLYCGLSLCNPAACAGCKIGVFQTGLAAALTWFHAKQIKSKLQGDTQLFINETTPRWRASQAIFADQKGMDQTLRNKWSNTGATNPFSKDLAAAGNMPGVTPNDAPNGLNTAEMSRALDQVTVGWGVQPYHASQVVNASRGHPFMPERNGGGGFGWWWKLSIPWSLPAGLAFTDDNDTGRGYLNNNTFTNGWNSFVSSTAGAAANGHPGGTFAQDWGDKTRVLLVKPFGAACTIFGPIALVVGLLGKNTSNQVRVGPFQHGVINHNVQHSFPTFPPFMDYNADNSTPLGMTDEDDLYSVPKNLSMVSVDPKIRNDPWESRGRPGGGTAFSFALSKTTGGTAFDMTNEPATHTGNMQNAIGAGVTYYSRPQHYEEPPNLFAPYWRSGLTRMTVDRPKAGGRAAYDNNLENMFNASGQPEAGKAFRELVNSGYKGFE